MDRTESQVLDLPLIGRNEHHDGVIDRVCRLEFVQVPGEKDVVGECARVEPGIGTTLQIHVEEEQRPLPRRESDENAGVGLEATQLAPDGPYLSEGTSNWNVDHREAEPELGAVLVGSERLNSPRASTKLEHELKFAQSQMVAIVAALAIISPIDEVADRAVAGWVEDGLGAVRSEDVDQLLATVTSSAPWVVMACDKPFPAKLSKLVPDVRLAVPHRSVSPAVGEREKSRG